MQLCTVAHTTKLNKSNNNNNNVAWATDECLSKAMIGPRCVAGIARVTASASASAAVAATATTAAAAGDLS